MHQSYRSTYHSLGSNRTASRRYIIQERGIAVITSSSPSLRGMNMQHDSTNMEGAAFPWILEHLLAYPGTYEIPLRTMYTLNVSTQTQSYRPASTSPNTAGNAFPKQSSQAEARNLATATAAAQLRSTLVQHITQLPSQPASLPASFVTTFVRRCFSPELEHVDFPQSLTALDYLKDFEVRRRREVVAALDKLGIERDDIGHRERLANKYPGVLRWVVGTEEKERKIEALYTQVYLGLRRWILINELSLTPFNKANCVAMLNTVYPPVSIANVPFVQPTAQLSATVLSNQRGAFFRYITAVEKNGASVLTNLMDQHKRPGETTGWTQLRDTLDNYLRMGNNIIEECIEITGHGPSPTAASFCSVETDEDPKARRDWDSGISFGSSTSSKSNRDSGQSHATRPSTSSSFSNHSRKPSKEEKQALADGDDVTITQKTSGSTLERIARELRKIKSKSNMRDEQRGRNPSIISMDSTAQAEGEQPTSPQKPGLRLKRSLKRMRSASVMRDSSTSRPASRADGESLSNVPAFDAEEMRRKRALWEQRERSKESSAFD